MESPIRAFARPDNESFSEYMTRGVAESRRRCKTVTSRARTSDGTYFISLTIDAPWSPNMGFYARPSAHLRCLATLAGLGTTSRSSGIVRFVQGGVVETLRFATQSIEYGCSC